MNADTGDPVGNVQVSVDAVRFTTDVGLPSQPAGWILPTDSAMSGGDGTFTLPLKLRTDWSSVELKLTDPGFEDMRRRFDPTTAGTRAEIRAYPALVIRAGQSIDVRIDEATAYRCAFGGAFHCRRMLVEASQSEPVKLEIVPRDASKPMGLVDDVWSETPVLHLMVPPGNVVYVYGPGTGRLTASR